MIATPGGRTRRALLASLGATVVPAGCLGVGSDDEANGDDHAALDGIDDVPALGPEYGDAEATIVEFGDPSCANCAQFSDDTFPELRETLIDPDRVSYYWRAFPVVEPWGPPAARALFAVHERDPDGFWSLKRRYYDERSSTDAENVRDRTIDFLEDGVAAVDADVVLEAMDGGDDAVLERLERDEAAAEATEVEVVPSFVLFGDGAYVTTVVGNQPYEVFEGALEL